jgi:anti-sigma factor RsiW
MSPDELEFLISQYIDGTLNPLDRTIVEEKLAIDPAARELLRRYESLNSELKISMPLPEIAWDDFAASIQSKTALLDPPIRHYRLTFATMSKFASLAAMIMIAVGLVAKFHGRPGDLSNSRGGSAVAEVNLSPVQVQVNGPAPISSAVAKVTIGAAPDYAAADFHSAESIITRPTSLWISSGSPTVQDSDATPY